MTLLRHALTLGLAVAGGTAAQAAGLPLAFLLGPLAVVMAAALAGAPLARPPDALVTPMRTLLGVAIGATFTPAFLARPAELALCLGAVALYVVIATALSYAVYRRMGRYSRAESFFSSLPGGLYTMTAYAEDLGVDVHRIALAHTLRIAIIVLVTPALIWALGLTAPARPAGAPPLSAMGAVDLAVLAAVAVVGYAVGRGLRLPGGAIIGPMLVSSALHLLGWSDVSTPAEGLALAQVVLGAAIGARFVGETAGFLARGVLLVVASVGLSGFVTLAMAMPLAEATGRDLLSVLLALAPGGMAEMGLIAVALGLDAAFVTALHLARILIVMLGAPLVWARAGGPR